MSLPPPEYYATVAGSREIHLEAGRSPIVVQQWRCASTWFNQPWRERTREQGNLEPKFLWYIFLFALYGSREAGPSLKIACGDISAGEFHSETYIISNIYIYIYICYVFLYNIYVYIYI